MHWGTVFQLRQIDSPVQAGARNNVLNASGGPGCGGGTFKRLWRTASVRMRTHHAPEGARAQDNVLWQAWGDIGDGRGCRREHPGVLRRLGSLSQVLAARGDQCRHDAGAALGARAVWERYAIARGRTFEDGIDMNVGTWASKAEKAKDLNNSVLFDIHKWSNFPEVNAAVDALFAELRMLPEFGGKSKLRKKHVKVVVLNLYVAWLQAPDKWVAYHRMKEKYGPRGRYNELHISYLTVAIVDALHALGYIEHVLGHYDKSGQRPSHVSRMRATQKLLDLIHVSKIVPQMVCSAPERECIILRARDEADDKQRDIEYQDTDETRRMRAELSAYNQHLAVTDIRLSDSVVGDSRPDGPMPKVDLTNKFVRRIFANGSWDEGGRFYGGWWQTVPREWRSQILIDGKPLAELDYSGLHVVLLYALAGLDYWKEIGRDPYWLDGYERSDRMRGFLKLVLLCCLFADSQEKAIKAMRSKVHEREDGLWGRSEEYGWVADEEIDLKKLVEAFAEAHPRIRRYFFSDYSTKLQRIDSLIAERVISEFTGKEIPILVLHDSFLIEGLKFDQLFTAMALSIDEVVEDELRLEFAATVKMKAKGYKSELINQLIYGHYIIENTDEYSFV
jgi:hypothetical protein